MNQAIAFEDVARIPEAGDNAAIAIRRLEAGTRILFGGTELKLPYTVLEGHRFICAPIKAGGALLSWGLPFGVALQNLEPGDYACNEKMLAAVKVREVDFALPEGPNFRDHFVPYTLDESKVVAEEQVALHPEQRYFDGFARPGGRGVGTRNFIAILGTSSLTASFARLLAERFRDVPQQFGNIDGVIPIAHTEGGGPSEPNNIIFVLRSLAGFVTHPNIAAVLAVDIGNEPMNNARLREFMVKGGYPLTQVPHAFISLGSDLQATMKRGEEIVRGWLESANTNSRTPQSLSHLRVALQCGGSDAFSGVSGNPLAGWISREVVRYGGSANICETAELIGAEPYMLRHVRNVETARKFLELLERFEAWAQWHGHSAEGNPSGGNFFRGLYNITVKSIGAARKKAPDVRLDYAIEHAIPMTEPGFYFMDSPGNDLEGIAGQVASGCNLVLFTTGNGSITNFPFVPTIKIMTNTNRFNLLSRDMDINAGRYLEGVSMDDLGRDAFEYTVNVCSGMKSVGEKAGHSQVQLWREWRQINAKKLGQLQNRLKPTGTPIALVAEEATNPVLAKKDDFHFKALATDHGPAADQIGLIVPTSLCSSQIARMIVDRLNASPEPRDVSRYVALAHTEGCGNSRGESETLYMRTMAGYLRHPMVRHGLLLEHGCEKTHNDEMRHYLQDHGLKPEKFGWASVQLEGGIDKVVAGVTGWFQQAAREANPLKEFETGLEQLRIGLLAVTAVAASPATALSLMTRAIVSAGGTVVIPQGNTLLSNPTFTSGLMREPCPTPSLAHGQAVSATGLHIMETQTDHYLETITGLGATGVDLMVVIVDRPMQAHPMIPILQVQFGNSSQTGDVDAVLDACADPATLAESVLKQALAVASRELRPRSAALGNTDFQVTRGWFGVSL